MPIKSGKPTRHETAFAQAYAATGDREYSAAKAGYRDPSSGASRALTRPSVQADIARIQLSLLFEQVLPLAVKVHTQILNDPKAPAGARMQAVKLAYDRTLGAQEGAESKQPHEMTAEEIAKAINELTRLASDRATIIPPVSAQTVRNDADIFE